MLLGIAFFHLPKCLQILRREKAKEKTAFSGHQETKLCRLDSVTGV